MDIPRTDAARLLARRRVAPRVGLALAACALVALLAGSRALRRAAPEVARAATVVAQVKRGTFVREVRGGGRLVPEETRWITAVTPGRVERVPLKPGATVTPDTVVVTLENPDVLFASLEAERELATARADAVEIEGRLRGAALADEASVAALESELADVARRVGVYRAEKDLVVNALDAHHAEDRVRELSHRRDLATAQLDVARATAQGTVSAYREQLVRRAEVAKFRREQVDALSIRAGAEGIVVDVMVEPGQWAAPGAVLATVARPDRLKAEIRIPEQMAKDVTLGQAAHVDTHNGVIAGHVARVATTAHDGAVVAEIALDAPLPAGARPQLNVEASIIVDTVPEALFVDRPAAARSEATSYVYRLTPDGTQAERVAVALGRASTLAVEVKGGLREGDTIVVSDTTTFEGDRVALR